MNCCVKCFKDDEVKAIIRGLNTKGVCDFCGKTNEYVYDTDANNALAELFDGLLEIYTPIANLSDMFPKDSLSLLKDILYNQWNIFRLERHNIYRLITSICREKYAEYPEIFDMPVGIPESNDSDYLKKYSIIKTFTWDDFVQEIKSKNRFHTNYINKNVLGKFCDYVKQLYKAGTVFYRARICSDESGFDFTKMGAPPAKLATAGRANPEGISCLYLADSKKTTFHEIRAGVYDYVTVGEFELLQDIEVINLTKIDKISPFLDIDFATQLAINIDHLRKISNDIAKPLRRHDTSLDYLPTQYVSDYIKSQGYKGIQYKSTMCQEGFNLAIFDECLFECKEVTVYDIKALNYSYSTIE